MPAPPRPLEGLRADRSAKLQRRMRAFGESWELAEVVYLFAESDPIDGHRRWRCPGYYFRKGPEWSWDLLGRNWPSALQGTRELDPDPPTTHGPDPDDVARFFLELGKALLPAAVQGIVEASKKGTT